MSKLETEFWKLEITQNNAESGYIYKLSDKINNRTYSDLDYYYEISCRENLDEFPVDLLRGAINPDMITEMLQPPELPQLVSRRIEEKPESLEIQGVFDNGLEFSHTFRASKDGMRLLEAITISNTGSLKISPLSLDFGFRKMLLTQRGGWQEDLDSWILEALPTRRYCSQKVDHRREFYTASDLLYAPFDDEEENLKPGYAAEAWIWGTPAGRILINKYNLSEIEFSRFRRFPVILPGRGLENTALLFGGAAQYRGDPERSFSLEAGSSYSFGQSSYTFFEGEYEDGALLYRSYLESQGHGLKPGYNPPIHWNELYNLGWFAELAGVFANGREFKPYSREDLFREAELAVLAGAQCLYLDPGWDTVPGSTIWDESRLGAFEDFSHIIHERYGLKLALHLMMCFWDECEEDFFYWHDSEGNPSRDFTDTLLFRVCPNERWVSEKSRRLLELAGAGVDFFMFDFTTYGLNGLGCCDPGHGHEIPMSRQTHAENILQVMVNIKSKFPGLLIEAHDRIRGGLSDYHPIYFQDDSKGAFDELWGYEFMWNPLQDLLSGKALSLYEYNLASPIPLYLHINSGCDNSSMLQFWWYSSVVRHLGIGGIADETTQEFSNLKSAMRLYKTYRKFLVHGVFYGIDPLVHIHVSTEDEGVLVTAYNLSSSEIVKTIAFRPEKYGISSVFGNLVCYDGIGKVIKTEALEEKDGIISIRIIIPPLSPVIIGLGYGD
ncbi:MAG: hypothetical protein JEZ04_03905 [Spirochaetales bacterium]|nr:hypothetical protein [Spirochaetales bacterium]